MIAKLEAFFLNIKHVPVITDTLLESCFNSSPFFLTAQDKPFAALFTANLHFYSHDSNPHSLVDFGPKTQKNTYL